MFEAIAFSELDTFSEDAGSEEQLWMGRVAGFFCNFAEVENRGLADRLLLIL
jgi:hypothetical protein